MCYSIGKSLGTIGTTDHNERVLPPRCPSVFPALSSLRKNSFATHILTSAAKATTQNKAVIAALEALRHPKPESFRKLLGAGKANDAALRLANQALGS